MLNVFTTVLPDVPYIPLLYPNLGVQQRDSILFLNNAFTEMRTPFVKITDRIEDADCLLFAHNWPSISKNRSFIKEQAALAAAHGKPMIVFWHGDGDAPVALRGAMVFRTSIYRYDRHTHETAMPAYAEDLLGSSELQLREKHAVPPVIGFCGWSRYKNVKNFIGTQLQNVVIGLGAKFASSNVLARKKGLTYRRQAIRVLRSSSVVRCDFILRSSYSGHSKTIRMNADVARNEYKENLLGSDLALCVKGDGNYSYRFYEALSLGRIPLLIDTQCVLPLSDRIDYDSFILRVDYRDIEHLPAIVSDWWSRITPEEFLAMQRKAREAYVNHLSVEAFFRQITESIKNTSWN